jgi:FKBP-type peptidyl-prolyl cis-trans isomerase 2
MQPNTLSIHYSIKDNDQDVLLDQSRVVVPKKKGYHRIVDAFEKTIVKIFTGDRHE